MNPEDLEDRRTKLELRMNRESRKFARKLYRYLLLGLSLVIAFYVSSWLWLLVRFFFTVALTVFVVLPLTVLVLYLVWKGWIQKRP